MAGGIAAAQAETIVFQDTFGGTSTINNATPTPANASYGATAYQEIATKGLNSGTPSIASGHLRVGIVSTSSGINQIQALFSRYPVTLTNAGDYVEVSVVFTDEAGVFNSTANNALMLGLYNGSQQHPYASGQANSSVALAGGAEGWQGYLGRAYVSGTSITVANSNALVYRAAQTSAATANQDLIFTSGFMTAVGTSNSTLPAALTVGSQYTMVFRITKASDTTLTLAHSLYSGAGTSGTQLFTQNATTTSIATATFDGFALGYRAAGAATIMDVNAIKVVTTGSVIVVPQILTQPLGQTKSVGDPITLTVVADGGAGTALSYQWKKDGSDLSGATSDSFSIPSLTLADAGDYTVVVTDTAGSTTSDAAHLIVSEGAVAPQILTQPTGATLLVGDAATFSFTASGTAPLTYQWQISPDGIADYVDLSGATSTSYAVASAGSSDAGFYRAVVTNDQGHVYTDPVQLVVNQSPAITAQPIGATLSVGDPLDLSVTATGTPAPTYQWTRNGVAIAGATSATYSVGSVTGADSGTYAVVATNSVGSVTSSTVSVAVLSAAMAPIAMTPASGTSSVLPDTPLTITFNTTPSLGTGGTLRIFDASNDSVVDSVDLVAATTLKTTLRTAGALSALDLPVATKTVGGAVNWNYYPFTVSGNTVTIYPRNGALARGKSYYVQIDPGVFLDSTGLSYAGIADKTTWTFSTTSATPADPTHLTVAADGSGDFYTVQAAIDYVTAGNTTPTTISIRNGTYFELVYWTGKHNLSFVGQDATRTKIVYPTNNTFNGSGSSYHRGTFYGQNVHDIVVANLTIQNSTPQGGSQAEALILTGSATSGVQTGQNMVTGVKLYSFQDTVQINGQCYVSDCYIEGDVDFIWGTGPVFVENCDIHMRSRSGTAGYFTQIRNPATNHGYVFSHCRFSADAGQTGTVLGRIDPNSNQFPYSEVVLLNCVFGDATNNAFLNTTVTASGSNFFGGWWLLNNVTSDVSATTAANVHNWDYNTKDYLNATPVFNSTGTRPAFTVMPTDDTTIAHYSDPVWVLGTTIAGTVNASWSPALAPVIGSQPQSLTVDAGQSASFTVAASGIPAVTYQWKKDGTDISGATSATYSVSNASGTDAGSYTVVVTNTAGSVTSSAATLTVNAAATAPAITTQPQSQTVNVGDNISFTVVASGTTPFTYQWKKGGIAIDNATSDTLSLTSVQLADAGDYTVVVTNGTGSATSDVATLTVQGGVVPSAPVATAASAITSSGFTANWNAATGASDYRLDVSTDSAFGGFVSGYQDKDAGSGTSVAVSGLAVGTTYYYRVRATNTYGTSASSNTITAATSAATANITIVNNGTTGGRTYALGGAPYVQDFDTLPSSGTFTWADSSTLAGWYAMPTTGSLDPAGVIVDGSANMADLKIGSVGVASSSERALAYQTKLNTAPTYLGLAFTNDSGRDLDSFTLSYTAEQWREVSASSRNLSLTVQYHVGATLADLNATTGWTTISGLDFSSLNGSAGATATLTATAVPITLPPGSTIWFRWVTANTATATNNSNDIVAIDNVHVSLTAVPDGSPTITTLPATQTVNVGADATFTIVATGDAPLTYQWSKDGNAIDGATSPTLSLSSVQSADAGSYTVAVTNGKGTATSAAAVLTVHVPVGPSITTQPVSQTVTAGDNVTFTVVATGDAPLSYVWKHDGNAISGATASTLTLTGVQNADAGSYTVDVANSVRSVTSDAATLTVQAVVPVAPTITTQPASATVTAGGAASFTVVATGTAPLSYQWYKGTDAVSGATGSTLTLTNAQDADVGSYTVIVTNDLGSATSDAATLTVTAAAPLTEFNLTGFAAVGTGTTGGGELADTDPHYAKVTTPQEFLDALYSNYKNQAYGAYTAPIKVIEIMNDLNLGYTEVGTSVTSSVSGSTLLTSHNAPKLHPVLLATGVSKLDIKPKLGGLTIFSANGATIKHVTFNVKGTSNIIVRNLKFDEMWEWDEASKGNYDSNDWDFIDLANGGDTSNVWIDHCTFTKAYDGIVDMKAGATNVTISWCKYVGDDGATNQNSFVRQQIAALEAHKSSTAFYKFLRDTCGYSVEDIVQIIQGHDKTHLMGANSLKTENDTLTATFHHLWMKNVWDRAVPRLRGGNVHDYNIFVDDTEALAARRLRDNKAALLTTAQQNTLNNTYSFRPPLNGAISTEGGSVLVEKSIYKDCLWPLRNNQTDPSDPEYTGKIKAIDSIYSFLNPDNTTTYVRGDSNDAGNPMGPFQATVIPFAWDLDGGVLPYTYTADDPSQLESMLAASAGAGALTWSKDNWLKTTYTLDTNSAPIITAQPLTETVATGADVTFAVRAVGSDPLTYQWMKDSQPLSDGGRISGATSAVLTISSLVPGDAGGYSVHISNNLGSTTSNSATLTVVAATAPTITTQPQPQFAVAGNGVEFTVVAAGSAPLAYQWQHNGSDLTDQTGSTLDLTDVHEADSGSYTVTVSNSAGSVTSDAATLTLGTPPAAPVPADATKFVAGGFSAHWAASDTATSYRFDLSTSASFDSFVSGYQDVYAGSALFLDLTGLTPSTIYYYRVRAVNAFGTSDNSATIAATTTADQPAVVTPVDVSQLSWYNTRTSDSVAADTGAKTVTFTEGQSSASAYIAHLPSAVSLAVGQSMTVTVTFQTGSTLPSTTNALRFGLFNANGTRISASANSETNTVFNDDTGYMVSYNFSTGAGTLYSRIPGSSNSTLMGSTASGLYLGAGATNPSGTTAALAPSTAYTLTYIVSRVSSAQTLFWAKLNGGSIANYLLTGSDTTTASISNGTYDEFAVRVAGGTNSLNTLTLTGVGVSVSSYVAYTDVPVITTQPAGQTVAVGAPVTLSVAANGIAPVTYQWRRNGTDVNGATSPTFALATAQTSDSGDYTVVVTNLAGSVTSDVATLVVGEAAVAPTITTQPQSQTVAAGSNAAFSVAATGTAPLTYQWYKAQAAVSGATSATLSLTNVQPGDAGSYTVTVTNGAGSITSSAAVLTVGTAPVAPVTSAATSVTSSGFTANWAGAADATGYRLDVSTDGAFGSFVSGYQDLDVGTALTSAVTGLSANTTYYYRVRAVNSSATSASSNVVPVTTAPVVLDQTITFAALPDVTTAHGPIMLSATASSSLPVTFTVSGPATLAGNTLTLAGTAGTVTVRASQAGNAGYHAAPDVTRSFAVTEVTIAPAITTEPTAKAVNVGDAVTFTVVATGTPTPTYQWAKDGAPISGATSASYSIATAAVTDAGSYTVVVTNSAGSVTSSAVSLTVNQPDFAGIYFGQFGSGGDWALYVRTNQTGLFVAYLPDRLSALVLELTVQLDGTFTVTGSEITGSSTTLHAFAFAPKEGASAKVQGVGSAFTLKGRISGEGIQGEVDGLGESFSGTADSTTGGSSSIAGIYASSASGSSSGSTYTIIGASGHAVVVAATPGFVTGGSGTVDSGGKLTVTTADSAKISLTVSSDSQSISTSVLPQGATEPITFTGTSTSDTAPKITSPKSTTFTLGLDCTFTVQASGQPAPTFAATGLPDWLKLNAATGVLSGKAPSGTAGAQIPLVLTAHNGVTPDATQAFTVTVQDIPAATTPMTVSTLAGKALSTGTADATGTSARFNHPTAIAGDDAATLYVADTDNNTLRAITTDLAVTTLAGFPGDVGADDGNGGTATFHSPTGVAVDASGNIYVADTLNHIIRKVTAAGDVTTFAGLAGVSGSADDDLSSGAAAGAARFFGPQGLAIDATYLYVADTNNATIRRIDLATAKVSTVAGVAGKVGSTDGLASVAKFNGPSGVAVDADGNLFVADTDNNTIRRITAAGQVSTLAGLSGSTGAADGKGTAARFNHPTAVAVGGATVYVVDTDNHTIRRIAADGTVTTAAGIAGKSGSTDGVGAAALFNAPSGLLRTAAGTFYVADTNNHTVRRGIFPEAPVITSQPQDQTATEGGAVTFSVTATGFPAPTYQWMIDGTPIRDATSSSYNLSVVHSYNAGKYSVVVTNSEGSVTSSDATLTVNAAGGGGSSGGSGGGGGAPGAWFYLALALLVSVRWMLRLRSGDAAAGS